MIGLINRNARKEQKPVSVPASLFLINGSFGVAGLEFDLLTGESHGLDFQVSEQPVEQGATSTDHVRQLPRECSVSGVFSNYPLHKESTSQVVAIDAAEALTDNRALRLYNNLESIAAKRLPVRLVTGMRVYDEMIIVSVKADKAPQDGETVRFTMRLREWKTVRLEVVALDVLIAPPDMSTDQNRRASVQKSSGRVSAEQRVAEKIAGLRGVSVFGGS